jgi:hypothetical protein
LDRYSLRMYVPVLYCIVLYGARTKFEALRFRDSETIEAAACFHLQDISDKVQEAQKRNVEVPCAALVVMCLGASVRVRILCCMGW